MKKKLHALEQALGVVSTKPALSGWVVAREIQVYGPTTAATFVEIETRTSLIRTMERPVDRGGSVCWNENLAVWVDSAEEEMVFVFLRTRHVTGDETMGSPAKFTAAKVAPGQPTTIQLTSEGNTIVLMMDLVPAPMADKPQFPKGDYNNSIGDFNVPDARFQLQKGGMSDYSEFQPLTGPQKAKRGGVNDYGSDFGMPSNSRKFQLKRGGLNDYGEGYALPPRFREVHGGINDYFTC